MDDDHFEKVLAVIRQNFRLTAREVATELGIRKRSCHLILTDKQKMRHVAAKFVSRLLTDALLIREFLTKHEATVVPQPPYSPDLDPADFFLFPKLKSSLKGRRFQTKEEIEENSLWNLHAIPQNMFQDSFQNWKKQEWCIKRGGEYFEGDKFD
jgi:transposase